MVRSISPSPFLLSTYNVGQHLGPNKIENVGFYTSKEVQDARMENLVWIFIRMASQAAQTVSNWTVSEIQSRDEISWLRAHLVKASRISSILAWPPPGMGVICRHFGCPKYTL